MDPKPRPNHRLCIQVLRRMTPEQRLLKAFRLSEIEVQFRVLELRKRFPDLSDQEFRQILMADGLEKARAELLISKGFFPSPA